ncbi:hypothetical protein QAD02_008298 [Eretmocerus hayati]|uniref:Uncharacterized protein n=1 Tax=Eretmocerus hayati TaxID=131215 RepID=A0ACC2N6C2_9HYME|nr:hypothetical protein QAD02_008298 [Eretmocerus hayati]
MPAEACAICDCPLHPRPGETTKELRNLTENLLQLIISASIQKEDGKETKFERLQECLSTQVNLQVHANCAEYYTSEKSIKAEIRQQENREAQVSSLEEDAKAFDYSNKCFLCGIAATQKCKERVSVISSSSTVKTIKDTLEECPDYEFHAIVKARLNSNVDFVYEHARYHAKCLSRLLKYEKENESRESRPYSAGTTRFLHFLFTYIDSQRSVDCQFSINDIKYEFTKNSDDTTEIPSNEQIKSRLKQHYGNTIIFNKPKPNDFDTLFCFDDKLTEMLNYYWLEHQGKSKEESENDIIRACAELTLKEIRTKFYETKEYMLPSIFFDYVDQDIPPTLNKFLQYLIVEPKKESAESGKVKWRRKAQTIGHCIISAVRPRTFISPILLGISTTLHRKMASKGVIQYLSSIGLSATYRETMTFENSIAINAEHFEISGEILLQLIVDNADKNTRTLDGRDAFHKLGTTVCITPKSAVRSAVMIDRVTDVQAKDVIERCGYIPVREFNHEYDKNPSGWKNFEIKNIVEEFQAVLPDREIDCFIEDIETIWLHAKNDSLDTTLGWNAFMEKSFQGHDYDISKVIPMPFVDGQPSDIDTIFTALTEAIEICNRYGMNACIITFDQPLYAKAHEVRARLALTSPMKSRLFFRNGGLHLIMSFEGSTGYIMQCSGLEEAFHLILAENSTDQVLSGNMYARAVRGHSLIHLALADQIFSFIN